MNRPEYCPDCNRHLATGYGTILINCRACGWKFTGKKEQTK